MLGASVWCWPIVKSYVVLRGGPRSHRITLARPVAASTSQRTDRTAPVTERSVARLPKAARRGETQRKREPFLSFVAVAATLICRLRLRK